MFVCYYWGKSNDGRRSFSQRSNQAVFRITDLPPPPSLSADPSGPLYHQGEMVTLQCSAPRDAPGMRFKFFHLTAEQIPVRMPSQMSSGLSFTVTKENSGLYSCQYSKNTAKGNTFSQKSRPINISLTDPPPPPVLKVDPPSGMVNAGDPLLIYCLASRSHTEKQFHFYRDGAEMPPTSEATLRSSSEFLNASICISEARANHTGKYACSYVEKHNVLWLSSPRSLAVNVRVGLSSSSEPLLEYPRWALPFMILLVPLTFYCRSRAKT
ncbi:Fc receptor-like protein 5, partial [Varanus komodoensis]|uniref:Fc receptor-like protein 5 n=1 Tax=Varanus komodoensis TaxID=61221 RepID=UPI001CF7DFB2